MVKSESEAINEVKVGHQQFLPLALTNKPFRGNFRQHLKLFLPLKNLTLQQSTHSTALL